MNEEVEDKGKGKDGEGEDKGKGVQDSEMLMRGMAVIAKGISEMQASNAQLAETLRAAADGKGKGGNGKDDEGEGTSKGGIFDGVDMEQLDRKDFAAILMSKFEERLQHHMTEAVKPLGEQIGKVSSRLEEDLANREVNTAAGQRPDFYEWRPEIATLVRKSVV